MQSAARVEGEHTLGEAHACLCPPREAVPVDGLRLGDARVIHEREPDPESILRQRRRNVPPCLALRLHLTPTISRTLRLPRRPISHAGTPHSSSQHRRPPAPRRTGGSGRRRRGTPDPAPAAAAAAPTLTGAQAAALRKPAPGASP